MTSTVVTGARSGPVSRSAAKASIMSRVPAQGPCPACRAREPAIRTVDAPSWQAGERLKVEPQATGEARLERFTEAISLTETPARGAKPLFVFEDSQDRDDE
ncbi:hypothetical protein ABZZ36_41215 [Actinacidiphila glaucinigra]|uniref:hypothetical protein n=1 Tax=Actinacidiphila glaucinigra TaxID=235986 RepID=UPI0033B40245